MYRMFVLVSVILISATLAFPQGHDDHNDAAPVQSGYAIVTPVATTTSANTSGLVVFETFGLRESAPNATQAGVLPPDLTTSAILFVESSGRLSRNLGVAIVNPNNGSTANVTLTLRKSDGTQLASTTINVLPLHQMSEFITQLFNPQSIPSDVTGTLAITSNIPVSAIGLRFRGREFSTIPVTNLSPASLPSITTTTGTGNATIGGSGAVLLPQFAARGGWATELVLIDSNSGSPLTVRVDLFKPDGTPLSTSLNGQTNSSFTNITIPSNGVFVLAPRDRDGDDDF